jgi:PAS domain S-box-containing protein
MIGAILAILAGFACLMYYLGYRNKYFLILGIVYFFSGSVDIIQGIISFERFGANIFFSSIIRMLDFSVGIIFFVVFILIYKEFKSNKDTFNSTLLTSIILNLLGKIYMATTKQFYNLVFDIAQLTSVLSYIMPVLGIMINMLDKMKALEKSERRLREMADNMLDFMCRTDIEGNIIYVSSSYCRATNKNYKELKGISIYDLIHPEDLCVIKKQMEEPLKNNYSCTAEFRMKLEDDLYTWVECIGNPITDENDIVIGAVYTNRDITERKIMEEELKKSEEKYRNFFNMCPDYIYLLDMESKKISEVNPSMLKRLGTTEDNFIPIRLIDYYVGGKLSDIIMVYNKLLNGEEVKGAEVTAKDTKGELFKMEVNYTPIVENGQVVKSLCMARDITEKKRMEELERSVEEERRQLNEVREYDRIKTEFFANISHELRTPINVIFSALQVLELKLNKDSFEKKDYNSFKYIKIMKQNCYRLLRLVNNLIDITKIDSGYFDINKINNDIVGLVEDITLSIVDYAENRGLSLMFDTDIEEKIIACDPEKIERIIMNLLSNAVKFTGNGGNILVSIEDGEEYIGIRVKDDGRGVPENKLYSIFNRFVQVDKSLTRDHEGSGIGLSLVKSLVELHEGRISVKSEINVGTEFLVELPCKILPQGFLGDTSIRNNIHDNRIEKINIEFSDIYG